MKLFYSYIGRLRSYLHRLWYIVKDKSNKIFSSATNGHFALVMPGRHLILIFCFIMFSYGVARPQSPGNREAVIAENIKPLSIGDQIPEELWNMSLQVVNHPEGKETITLSEYKGKLIILDFWATWCVPCIRNFPKLHALQGEFGDKIKLLAVTKEAKTKITTFFETGAGKEHSYVNSVVSDIILSKFFPHFGVPHIVWIDPNGKVLNTTQAEDINKINIQAILAGQKIQMASKIDIDRKRPLFLSENFNDSADLRSYSIFSKGYHTGLSSGGNIKRNKQGDVYGRQFTNSPIMDIYYPIIYELFKDKGEQFNLSRAIIDVKDRSLLNGIFKADSTFEGHNLYSYELIVPEQQADSLFYFMLEDLNRYSDYRATIEKRLVDCLILVRTSSKDKIKTKGGTPNSTFPSSPSILTNHRLSVMINMLAEDTPIKLPIVDETGYQGNVDIKVSGVKDIDSFKKELHLYDLDLIPAKRYLHMFVLKDK